MSNERIFDIELDETSLAAGSPDAEHERRVAIFDLLEGNSFALEGAGGPYRLKLAVQEGKLVFDIAAMDGSPLRVLVLSLSPFRRVIKDYFLICDSYYDAIRHAAPAQIEAIDMGRRGLHNEGSVLLAERLKGKVDVDHDTARRLFTLICALHARA